VARSPFCGVSLYAGEAQILTGKETTPSWKNVQNVFKVLVVATYWEDFCFFFQIGAQARGLTKHVEGFP
jgi:hypothetical protein